MVGYRMFYSGWEAKDSGDGAEIESRQSEVNKVPLDGKRRKVPNLDCGIGEGAAEHAIACL
jgi:hypothetical protein